MTKKRKTYNQLIKDRVDEWKRMKTLEPYGKEADGRDSKWCDLYKTQIRMEKFVAECALEQIAKLESK
jgi:hypothetical protein